MKSSPRSLGAAERLLVMAAALLWCTPALADWLPSWNDTAAKRAIVSFVERTTTPGSPDFIAPEDRIAVFDNDGTLWSEQPLYFEALFVIDRVRALAPRHPEWRTQEPFASVLRGDVKQAFAGGPAASAAIMAATHAGMTTDEFERAVSEWIATARHPQSGRLYTEMIYRPMLELLAYLRANGYRSFIVSGGGVEFMRAWSERVYGIPRDRVIGSAGKLRFEMRPTGPAILKLAEVDLVDDKAGKPVGIQRHIGRRPVAAFGNSDGDLEMLQWTAAGPGPRFALLVHHTDAEREWAYDRTSHVGRLDAALDQARLQGWTVVDMKGDWRVVHPSSHEEGSSKRRGN